MNLCLSLSNISLREGYPRPSLRPCLPFSTVNSKMRNSKTLLAILNREMRNSETLLAIPSSKMRNSETFSLISVLRCVIVGPSRYSQW